MRSSLAVHFRIDGPPLTFDHAMVVERSMPVIDFLPIAQLHLGRSPDPATVLQVGNIFYGPDDAAEGTHLLDWPPMPPQPTDEQAQTADPGSMTVGDLKNSNVPVRLIISELDGWVFDITLRPFDGTVPDLYAHPDFEQGFIPAAGTSTFQLANVTAPNPTPNRFRQLSRFPVAAMYEPELPDVTWELYIAAAMRERGLKVASLPTLIHLVHGSPHRSVLTILARDLAGADIPLSASGYPAVAYVRGLVAQVPGLIRQAGLVSDPEDIRCATEVTTLPSVFTAGEELGLFRNLGYALRIAERGESLSSPTGEASTTKANAELTVDLAAWLVSRAGDSFPSTTGKNSGLADVIDFRNFRRDS